MSKWERNKQDKWEKRERELWLFWLWKLLSFCAIAGCEKIGFTNGVLRRRYIYYPATLIQLWSNIERLHYSCKPWELWTGETGGDASKNVNQLQPWQTRYRGLVIFLWMHPIAVNSSCSCPCKGYVICAVFLFAGTIIQKSGEQICMIIFGFGPDPYPDRHQRFGRGFAMSRGFCALLCSTFMLLLRSFPVLTRKRVHEL